MDDAEWDKVIAASNDEESEIPKMITIKELVKEQFNDEYCSELLFKIDQGIKLPFRTNPTTGALERTVTGRPQAVIPRSLQQRVLDMAHYSAIGAHVGARKCTEHFSKTSTG